MPPLHRRRREPGSRRAACLHAGNGAPGRDHLVHRRIRQQRGPKLAARPRIAERNLHRLEIDVRAHVHHRAHAVGHAGTASGAGPRRARSSRRPGRAAGRAPPPPGVAPRVPGGARSSGCRAERTPSARRSRPGSRSILATPLRRDARHRRRRPAAGRSGPAARGEVCEASSALSSSATDSPALARWNAVAAPSAPAPMTTTSTRSGTRRLVHVCSSLHPSAREDGAPAGARHASSATP